MNKCANPDCECEACDCGDNCTCDKENHADKKGGKSDAKCACTDGQDDTCRCSGKKGKK